MSLLLLQLRKARRSLGAVGAVGVVGKGKRRTPLPPQLLPMATQQLLRVLQVESTTAAMKMTPKANSTAHCCTLHQL